MYTFLSTSAKIVILTSFPTEAWWLATCWSHICLPTSMLDELSSPLLCNALQCASCWYPTDGDWRLACLRLEFTGYGVKVVAMPCRSATFTSVAFCRDPGNFQQSADQMTIQQTIDIHGKLSCVLSLSCASPFGRSILPHLEDRYRTPKI